MSNKKIEEEPSTTSGAIAIADRPLGPVLKRKYKKFDVSNETFKRFEIGRTKFERWSKFLNLEDSNEKSIYDYFNKTRGNAVIVLRNADNGAMRAIRTLSK